MTRAILDHVAIAVKDLDKAQKIFEDLGLNFKGEREVVADQGVETAFAAVDQNAQLELLNPHGDDGPIHQYIAKKGEGIHHLCFRVDDVAKTSEELRSKGYQLIYDIPKVGAHNCLVNFVHPKSTGGVLIEISTPQGDRS